VVPILIAGPVAAGAELDPDEAELLPDPAPLLGALAPPEDALDDPPAAAADEDVAEGAELDDALSVRPDPQAASDTAKVRAPAAATSRRDVVLRMNPLSAGGAPAERAEAVLDAGLPTGSLDQDDSAQLVDNTRPVGRRRLPSVTFGTRFNHDHRLSTRAP
jgi:hypothetical protein